MFKQAKSTTAKVRKYAANIQMSSEKLQLAIYQAIFATYKSNMTKGFCE